MKPYEFTRIYHPSLGKFVYEHKGSGLIVDSIFKPMKKIGSAIGKKALTARAEHIGKRIAKKVEKW